MLELSQLYVMQTMNQFYERGGYSQKMLISKMPDSNEEIKFMSEKNLEHRVKHLETKMSPE